MFAAEEGGDEAARRALERPARALRRAPHGDRQPVPRRSRASAARCRLQLRLLGALLVELALQLLDLREEVALVVLLPAVARHAPRLRRRLGRRRGRAAAAATRLQQFASGGAKRDDGVRRTLSRNPIRTEHKTTRDSPRHRQVSGAAAAVAAAAIPFPRRLTTTSPPIAVAATSAKSRHRPRKKPPHATLFSAAATLSAPAAPFELNMAILHPRPRAQILSLGASRCLRRWRCGRGRPIRDVAHFEECRGGGVRRANGRTMALQGKGRAFTLKVCG